jgi:hypothetical protein
MAQGRAADKMPAREVAAAHSNHLLHKPHKLHHQLEREQVVTSTP